MTDLYNLSKDNKDLLTLSKDNCGCGLIGNVRNIPSRQMTLDAIEGLKRMMHRGAVAADQKSGDGAGFLFSIPKKFMDRVASAHGHDLPSQYAIATIFTKNDKQLDRFAEICAENDLKVLFNRLVPVNDEHLGEQAQESQPKIYHSFVIPNALIATRRFDALQYLTRKIVEAEFAKDPDFYLATFSDKIIAYKGLVMPTLMEKYFLDLDQNNFEVSFALFHQRFSTNTLPKWGLAQPFRSLCHNGEINSIQANIFNAITHEETLESEVFSKAELKKLFPIINSRGSDSKMLDNFLEFMLINGFDFFKTVRSIIPPPWQNAPHMDAKLRSFYEYVATNFEAWDGPAAVNVTDGRYLACVLDRNGLRPAKYSITRDDRIIVGSEFGIIDIEPHLIKEQGRLQSGQMIAVDMHCGMILKNDEINDFLKKSKPYDKWLNENSAFLLQHVDYNFENHDDYIFENQTEVLRYHNITHEVLENIVSPMLKNGKEETGSMGDDTPLACLSDVQRNFTDFFRQKFAQVTNPPIDPLRERVVMSTAVSFGSKNNILQETVFNAHRIRSITPILNKEKMDVLRSFGTKGMPLYDPDYKCQTFYIGFVDDLKSSLAKLAEDITDAIVKKSLHIIILDDRVLNFDQKLMPMALVVGYLNRYLQKNKLRSKVSLVAISGEVQDSHSLAVLLGYGLTAAYPYLLFTAGLMVMNRKAKNTHKHKKIGLQKIVKALNTGLLKIMSKMGIATVESYCNSALFDIVGLSEEIVNDSFSGSYAFIKGLTYKQIETRINKNHAFAYRNKLVSKTYALEVGSFYKFMKNGEYHDYSPDVIHKLHKFTNTKDKKDYTELSDRINNRGFKMIRDFFEFKSDKKPIALSKVESTKDITWRFSSAAMSLGSISPEAHEAMAEAMNIIGGKSNSGEGGEDPKRFGTIKNSKIKQIASGRFGVTPEYLRNAEELQIKVAQGAKPGEGGQLPGSKVSPLIATLRCTMPGVTLISPPPHHDIYSIEDLAQLIFDLKQINPKAQIGVKLVSSAGVGTIACGVAKAYADKIIISGSDGGTGAAQLGSIKFAGNPWELGLSEAHNALKTNNLRHMVELQTDGGLKTGLDIVKAAMMGAETFAFGTMLLSTVGCKILRICHLNKCSVGIATQDDQLRAHYKGTVDGVVAYLTNVAEEIREILAKLGYTNLNAIIGRTDLLDVIKNEKSKCFDFSDILKFVEGDKSYKQVECNQPFDDNKFENDILNDIRPAIDIPYPKTIAKTIKNTNRSFGALISGYIAEKYGDKGLPKNTLRLNLNGTAGQSLGVFSSHGMAITLKGTANDYVGKGMRGGQIVITPQEDGRDHNLAGNTCLYGATGGKLFISGTAGERFAVRNSGALAVVEGTGDHACEYMTGGTVVILGETGINFGAGMTGGAAFVYDPLKSIHDNANKELIEISRIDTDEKDEARYYLKKILSSHYTKTGSLKAKKILDYFREEIRYFWLITPKEMQAPLNPIEGN